MASTKFWNRPEGPLAYDDEGRGPLVVCVPGIGDLRQEYRFLSPLLVQAGYRVVTFDLRGLGESTVAGHDFSVAGVGADLGGLIAHLGAGPARVLGDSMAAGAAVWAAAEAPEQISHLVLLGPFVRGRANPWVGVLMAALFSGFWGPALWGLFYSSLYPTAKPQDWSDYLGRLKRNLREPGRLAALRAMLQAPKDASEARLSRVKAKTLVLMGTKDPDFPRPEAEAAEVARALRGEYRMIEGAGHYPHAEFPDKVAPSIVEFLGR